MFISFPEGCCEYEPACPPTLGLALRPPAPCCPTRDTRCCPKCGLHGLILAFFVPSTGAPGTGTSSFTQFPLFVSFLQNPPPPLTHTPHAQRPTLTPTPTHRYTHISTHRTRTIVPLPAFSPVHPPETDPNPLGTKLLVPVSHPIPGAGRLCCPPWHRPFSTLSHRTQLATQPIKLLHEDWWCLASARG